MATTQLDSLEIVISTNTKQANTGIRSLTKNLTALQSFVSDKLDLGTITTLEEHLQNISKIDFTNVSQGLKDVVSAFKSLQSKALSKGILKNANLTPAETTPSSYDTTAGISGEQVVMSKTIDWIDPAQAEETKGIIQTIIDYFKKLRKETDKTGDSSKKSASKFSKLVNAFKRVLFYRVVRRILQLIAQALKEGIQNMALFDEDFNKSMSNIKSSLSYLKDSLGTLLAPLIEMLEPFITMLLDGLGDVANKLSEVFSAMAGKDTFTKAVKGAEDYAESLKKVKDTTLGIDELNVIKPQEQNGNFEKAEVQETAINSALKEFGANLQNFLSSLFSTIGNLLSRVFGVLEQIMPVLMEILTPILQIADILIGIIADILGDTIEFLAMILQPFLEYIAGMLQITATFLKLLEPIYKNLLQPLFKYQMEILKPIFDGISSAINWILGKINDIYAQFEPIITILTALYENAIKKTYDNIFHHDDETQGGRWDDGYDFGDVLGTVVDFVKGAWSGLKSALGFATGGFPEDGIFYANHNELVGQFSNGQTVVANNEQIIEGIKQGVYEAMTMAGSDEKGGTQVVVYLDSKEIAKQVEKRTLARKNNNIAGAYKYGGQ